MLAVPLTASRGGADHAGTVEGHGAVVANHNAPNQVVVSGTASRQSRRVASQALIAEGVEPKPLKVATAFHSPGRGELRSRRSAEFLDSVAVQRGPKLPVYHNATAAPHAGGPAVDIRERLAERHRANPSGSSSKSSAMYEAGRPHLSSRSDPGHVLTNLTQERS